MPKLSDLVIMSDIDGTLLPRQGEIPQRNYEALHRFTQKGGKFAIATGRSVQWTRYITEGLPVNAPCVLYNGGVLYSFEDGSCMLDMYLPEEAKEYMVEITGALPGVGVLVVTNNNYFNVKEEIGLVDVLQRRNANYVAVMDWRDVPNPWYKVLFTVAGGLYDPFFEYVEKRAFPGIRIVATNENLIEMLPEKSSKGYALEQLVASGYVARENLVAIGDFYNDLEMIQYAGIGVTLRTSPRDIQEQADVIVGDCEGGALADLVEYLEQHYE